MESSNQMSNKNSNKFSPLIPYHRRRPPIRRPIYDSYDDDYYDDVYEDEGRETYRGYVRTEYNDYEIPDRKYRRNRDRNRDRFKFRNQQRDFNNNDHTYGRSNRRENYSKIIETSNDDASKIKHKYQHAEGKKENDPREKSEEESW